MKTIHWEPSCQEGPDIKKEKSNHFILVMGGIQMLDEPLIIQHQEPLEVIAQGIINNI